jgi:N utilization substance protein B
MQENTSNLTSEESRNRTLSYARHIGRELSLLTLSTLSVHQDLERVHLPELLERSVRMLSQEVEGCLEDASEELENAHEAMEDLQLDMDTKLNSETLDARDLARLRKQYLEELEAARAVIAHNVERVSYAVNLLGEALDLPLLRTLADNPQIREFTLQLVRQYRENQTEVDQLIDEVSGKDWPIERMHSIDRDLLRVAVSEMILKSSQATQALTPIPVIINEAVELAKKYGSPDSFRFVNGVLRNVLPHAEARRRG